MPTPDLSQLGKRTVAYTATVAVTDPSTGLRNLQPRKLTRIEYSSQLTDEEASQLDFCKWRPTDAKKVAAGHLAFTTSYGGRRFFANIDPSQGYDGPKAEEEKPPPPVDKPDFDLPPSILPQYLKLLIKANWLSAQDVLDAGRDKVQNIHGIGAVMAERIIDACSDHVSRGPQ